MQTWGEPGKLQRKTSVGQRVSVPEPSLTEDVEYLLTFFLSFSYISNHKGPLCSIQLIAIE